MTGRAQDFFRNFGTSRSSGGIGPVYPSEYSYEEGSPSGLRPLRPGQELTNVEQLEEEEKYNFAIGPLRFSFAAGVGLEWNDNINLSDKNRESDFIFRPTIDLESRWRLSELNTLRFSVQASYAKYFDHSELDTDGILLSPNSELALTFFIASLKFTVRDRFSYQEDTYDIPELSNVARYKRYENQAGINMDWQINQQLDLSLGYDHYNLWSAGGQQFDDQDRSIDTVYARPAVQITPALQVGLNAAYSYIDFQTDERSDGYNLLVGPFLQLQISDYTNLYLEGGYQDLAYDGASDFVNSTFGGLSLTPAQQASVNGQARDTSDSSTWYLKFEIQNKPSDFFRHRLSASKTSEIGFATNFYDLYHVEYDAEWKVTEKTDIGPAIFYEHYETSGSGAEKADRYGATFGVRQHLSNSLTLGLDYRFLLKNSNLPDADYYQNLAFLSLYYKF
ncbi:MAG: hypothetical protein QOE70_4570 [Chthoniobacter sp.]|nr:hypothetical protein [Chthoniobacter sp.]